MENKEKDDWGFGNGTLTYLLTLVLGLASMATIVPLFVNRTSEIFKLNFEFSFCFFQILYFIVPLILIAIWVFPKRKDRFFTFVLQNKKYKKMIWIVLSIMLVSIVFFFLHGQLYFYIHFGCMSFLFASGVCISTYNFKQYQIYKAGIDNQKISNQVRQAGKEFILLCSSAIFICLLWSLTNFGTTSKSKEDISCASFLYDFAKKDLKELKERVDSVYFIAQYQNQFEESKIYNFTKCELKCNFDTSYYRLVNLLSNFRTDPGEHFKSEFKCAEKYIQDSTKKYCDSVRLNIKLKKLHKLVDLNKMLDNKCQTEYAKLMEDVLRRTQFKGILMFFIVLIFLINLWAMACFESFKQKNEFERDTISNSNEKFELFSEINTLKSFIFLIILLIIPIFKPTAKESISIDKPLWSFTLKELVSGTMQYDRLDIYQIPNEPNMPLDGYGSILDAMYHLEYRLDDSLQKQFDSLYDNFDKGSVTKKGNVLLLK